MRKDSRQSNSDQGDDDAKHGDGPSAFLKAADTPFVCLRCLTQHVDLLDHDRDLLCERQDGVVHLAPADLHRFHV